MEKAYETLPLSQNDSAALRFLYGTVIGRMLLRPLISPAISKLMGFLLDRRFSSRLIKRFIKTNSIDMHKYTGENYHTFNAFFTRDIKEEYKRIPLDGSLFSPCDGKLCCYRIDKESVFTIKRSVYTIEALLDCEDAGDYRGGVCLIFRLAPDDYHRYCYIDSGRIAAYKSIPGELHTVRPIAIASRPVFTRNQREYALLDTERFGRVVQMEVGAMFVGRIRNHKKTGAFGRGEEKGMFEFGGSTIILLFPKDVVEIHPQIMKNTNNELETIVTYGQTIGRGLKA